ncbi:MAG: hypothetical protein ABII09_00565 [Planctomycetota bacterium]
MKSKGIGNSLAPTRRLTSWSFAGPLFTPYWAGRPSTGVVWWQPLALRWRRYTPYWMG